MKEWCDTILSSLATIYDNKNLFEFKMTQGNKFYEGKDIKQMKLLYQEVNSMASAASDEIKKELNNKLQEKFHQNLDDEIIIVHKKKALDKKKYNELELKKEWSLIIISFIQNIDKNEYFFEQLKNSVGAAFFDNDLKGIRMIYNDVNEWAKGLDKSQLSELNKILIAKFGRSLIDEEKEIDSKIEKIVKRGKINSEDEYRLILAKVDEIYADKSKVNTIKVLNDLLLKYDKAAH